MIALPHCALAMLALVVDSTTGITAEELLKALPPHVRIDELPGSITDWPHDVLEWYDELQQLLDLSLVRREAAERCYHYLATDRGTVVLRAALHPRGGVMRSMA